jgi:hypothetical protein
MKFRVRIFCWVGGFYVLTTILSSCIHSGLLLYLTLIGTGLFMFMVIFVVILDTQIEEENIKNRFRHCNPNAHTREVLFEKTKNRNKKRGIDFSDTNEWINQLYVDIQGELPKR